jgi:uroporphyrin-III C-methyltransferase / precorrin-2 dehydrogenase / sirohydrochlorin ferrochelatase
VKIAQGLIDLVGGTPLVWAAVASIWLRGPRMNQSRRTTVGMVSLVGAGPGDPELLTVRAVKRLGEADLVLYDALVSPEALRFAGRARRFFVGKRAGRPSISQETIHKLMIRWARRGYRVVRLKSGDPFVLGRGGEEVLALARAGIRFEIVPGVSSALAAPGLAGIPVTCRGLASAFVVLSGHDPRLYAEVLDGISPGSATVVVLMGLGTRQELRRQLLGQGWVPETPAAVLLAASTPEAFTWIGTLTELDEAPIPDRSPRAYGMVVVGDVVSLAQAHTPGQASATLVMGGPP